MLVCLCKGVSDKHVGAAIARGADTIEAVGDECGAGTGCGACHDMIAHLIAKGGQATPIDLARAATQGAHTCSGSCSNCPRRASTSAGITSPSPNLGEAA
jgi:bacterioferritin-associated ferredoxin